jgi:hypothetical protein
MIGGSAGITIAKSVAKRRNLLGEVVFPEYLGDLINQQVNGLSGRCTYLTSSVGQAEFLRRLARPEADPGVDRSLLLSYLAHSVPFFSRMPIDAVLRIRRNESDAFLRYRATLNGLVLDKVKGEAPISRRKAQDLFEDELRPRILALKAAARSAQRSAVRKSLTKAAVGTMAISIGVFGGLLTKELGQIISTVVGVPFFSDLLESLTAIGSDPPEVRRDDLYFLLRLNRETVG